MKTCIALFVVSFMGSVASASDGGWILWEKTLYFANGLDEAQLAKQGYSDRWTPSDGYDTAVDCHAAAKIKAQSVDPALNERSVGLKPVGFVRGNFCFPLGFDPRPK
jgi:hypothetical protein